MGNVPIARAGFDAEGILVGAPGRAPQAHGIARLSNWTLAQGAQLVPGYSPQVTIQAGDSATFHYRAVPRHQALERRLVLAVSCQSDGGAGYSVEWPDAASGQSRRAFARTVAVPEAFVWELSAQSSVQEAFSFTINNNESGGEFGNMLTVDWVEVWEHPRIELTTAADEHGADLTQILPGQPNTRDVLDGPIEALRLDGRLTRHLFSWAVPADIGMLTEFDSTAWQQLWSGDGIWTVPRQIGVGDTTAGMTGRIYYLMDGTGTWQWRWHRNDAVNSTAQTISATSWTWASALDFTLECEDLAAADGLRNGWEGVNVQVRRTSGTSTLYVASACGWDE